MAAPAALSSAPAILPYRAGLPVPPGYHVESRSASGLIVTGVLGLSVGYLAGLAIAAGHDFDDGLGWMALPIGGAWPAIAEQKIRCQATTVDEARGCLNDAVDTATTMALLAVDGMVQTTGALLLIAGLASGHQELVRDDLKLTAQRRPEGGFNIGVSGRF